MLRFVENPGTVRIFEQKYREQRPICRSLKSDSEKSDLLVQRSVVMNPAETEQYACNSV